MAFRTDIQALRGLAIILVVIYHAKFGIVTAGYLGVDIFFVISGYLITGMVKHSIEQGNFSFSAFYFRRAKRLLPAAYVCFLATALLSGLFLGTREMNDFIKQLVGAVTFTGNFTLWSQAGYFEGAAAMKPLLHVWSLSIEEQYYLLLPASLVIIPRRFWLPSSILLLIASLALCIALVPFKPTAAFYLLPTRGWELAVGSVATLASLNGATVKQALTYLFWPAAILLIVIPIAPIGTTHPGTDAIIVCFATAVVVLRRHKILNDHPAARLLAKIGDFSYSLYLVHWPIFAFINNAYFDEPPLAVHILAIGIALALGYLLFRYVEQPIRRTNISLSGKFVGATLLASVALMLVPVTISWAQKSDIDYAQIRRPNPGFSSSCEFKEIFTPKAECRNSDRPTFLVWGDSFAMHLVPGIAATSHSGVIQATMSVCGPFVGIAPIDDSIYNRAWAERCLSFNQSVLDYLATAKSIEVVVLSSPFSQYLDEPRDDDIWRTLDKRTGRLEEYKPDLARSVEALRSTIEMIRAYGKRVVIVAPPPTAGFDVGRCLERKATSQLILGGHRDCKIPIADYHRYQHLTLRFLDLAMKEAAVNIISFDGTLCSSTACNTELDGTFIYRDSGHLSYAGSVLVAKRMNLADLINKQAR